MQGAAQIMMTLDIAINFWLTDSCLTGWPHFWETKFPEFFLRFPGYFQTFPWESQQRKVRWNMFSLTITSHILCFPWVFQAFPKKLKFPEFSLRFWQLFKFPEFSRFSMFSRFVVTLDEGYEVKRLWNSFKKVYGRFPDLIRKHQRSVKDTMADSFPD